LKRYNLNVEAAQLPTGRLLVTTDAGDGR